MSRLTSRLFGDAEVDAALSDAARLQAMLDVEVALAEAECELGLVPNDALAPIREAARASFYDTDLLAEEAVAADRKSTRLNSSHT